MSADTLPTVPPYAVSVTVEAIVARQSTGWLSELATSVPQEHRGAFVDHVFDVAMDLERQGLDVFAAELLAIWEGRVG